MFKGKSSPSCSPSVSPSFVHRVFHQVVHRVTELFTDLFTGFFTEFFTRLFTEFFTGFVPCPFRHPPSNMDLTGAQGPPRARPGPTRGLPRGRPGPDGQGPPRGPPRTRNQWNRTKINENIENPCQVAHKSMPNCRKTIKKKKR